MYAKNRSANLSSGDVAAQLDESKRRVKDARKNKSKAKTNEAARAVSTGKAHGVVFYNTTSTATPQQSADALMAQAKEQEKIAKDSAKAARNNAKADKINSQAAKLNAGRKHGFIVFNKKSGEVYDVEASTIIYRTKDAYNGKIRNYEIGADGLVTEKQVRQTADRVGKRRSGKSRETDNGLNAAVTYPSRPGPSQLATWERNPSRYDIAGVDASPDAKTVKAKPAPVPAESKKSNKASGSKNTGKTNGGKSGKKSTKATSKGR